MPGRLPKSPLRGEHGGGESAGSGVRPRKAASPKRAGGRRGEGCPQPDPPANARKPEPKQLEPKWLRIVVVVVAIFAVVVVVVVLVVVVVVDVFVP